MLHPASSTFWALTIAPDRQLALMASFENLPTEIAQKCVEFLEFGGLKGSAIEVKSVSRCLRKAARWALTRGRWKPIRFVSEHGLETLQNLRGGLNSLDDGVAATFRVAGPRQGARFRCRGGANAGYIPGGGI